MKLTSDVKQRKQRSQHNSPNPNNSYKTKKKFPGSYTEGNPDLDLLKLAKKRKSVCSALFRGNVYIWSDKISNVSAILSAISEVESEPSLSENLKFRKRMG